MLSGIVQYFIKDTCNGIQIAQDYSLPIPSVSLSVYYFIISINSQVSKNWELIYSGFSSYLPFLPWEGECPHVLNAPLRLRAEPLPWKAIADLDTDRLSPSAPQDTGRVDNSMTCIPRAGPVSSWPITLSPHILCFYDLWGGRKKPLLDLGSNFFHKFSSVKEPWTLGYNGGGKWYCISASKPIF